MPVRPNRSARRAPHAATLIASLCLLFVLAGCASDGAATRPSVPDQSVLDPATQALSEAMNANAQNFSPRSIDAARRRITLARDILFSAARANRSLTDVEQQRIDSLVAAAQLDAREALVETQAKAVQSQVDELNNTSDTNPSPAASGGASGNGMGNMNQGPGLGIGGPGMGLGNTAPGGN